MDHAPHTVLVEEDIGKLNQAGAKSSSGARPVLQHLVGINDGGPHRAPMLGCQRAAIFITGGTHGYMGGKLQLRAKRHYIR